MEAYPPISDDSRAVALSRRSVIPRRGHEGCMAIVGCLNASMLDIESGDSGARNSGNGTVTPKGHASDYASPPCPPLGGGMPLLI